MTVPVYFVNNFCYKIFPERRKFHLVGERNINYFADSDTASLSCTTYIEQSCSRSISYSFHLVIKFCLILDMWIGWGYDFHWICLF